MCIPTDELKRAKQSSLNSEKERNKMKCMYVCNVAPPHPGMHIPITSVYMVEIDGKKVFLLNNWWIYLSAKSGLWRTDWEIETREKIIPPEMEVPY